VWLAAICLLSCAKPNCPSDYSTGDRFRITVNGSLSGDTPCDIMPLSPGDSFVLTVGAADATDPSTGCPRYSALPTAPDYAKGVLNGSCSSAESPMALSCCGLLHGCLVCMNSQVSPLPSGSQQVVEHAALTSMVSSYVQDWAALDGGACLPTDCAWDQYDVRIEKQ
jgi:hypothetical protein